MVRTLLIANRGEIACRIIRTARRMGIRTVAVHSRADAAALHVALADEAREIGPAPARDSYLSVPAIIAAARAAGADAIHPGYGFLSENAAFAEACAEAGIVFIGPPPAAIRAMGSKSAAKALMEKAGVPLVPGYHGEDQSPAALRAAAERVGYPLLIKASAGGGGKGMKVVETADEFDAALALAKGEARAAFADDHVLLERYLTRPRHIEIQVFADNHGNTIHLFERDCSIQRRHQKVVEEAPAPGMDPARREAMGRAACDAARAIGYVGAGTVEFIVPDDAGDAFHFMEMNTRLQVEHPVTEAITGQDLVEWQIRVAAGQALPLRQQDLRIAGHAIEVRLYAEDPARDFAPSTGRIHHLRLPEGMEGIRVDSGIREGDTVSIHYDPMLAKIVAHGVDREAAINCLGRALRATELAGPTTNLALLRAVIGHPAFRAGALDTGFIARHGEALLAPPVPSRIALAAAAAQLLAEASRRGGDPADPHSPWNAGTAWRLNGEASLEFILQEGEVTHTLRIHPEGEGFRLILPEGIAQVTARAAPDGAMALTVNGTTHRARVLRHSDRLTVFLDGDLHAFREVDPLAVPEAAATGAGRILAPMPGKVLEVAVTLGDRVARGALLLILEAMKVQMRITAPADGIVTALGCAADELVEDGTELVVIDHQA